VSGGIVRARRHGLSATGLPSLRLRVNEEAAARTPFFESSLRVP
jgi:hypothetical protein